jgi:leucyl aminopeptidase (aminopeptidase T)
LGQPLAELAVAFELQLSPEGRLVLEVMVCQQAQVNALQSKLLALGLNLKLLTAHSRHLEQSEFWHLSSSQLARLWQVVNSFDRHHPPVRVLI